MSKDMDEQLKLTQRVADSVDRPNRKICMSMLRYNVNKPESFYAQVPLSYARKKELEKFQQIVYVNEKLYELYISTQCNEFCI